MTKKIYNRFITMGYELVCKICDCPINIGDEVESKAGGLRPRNGSVNHRRTPKFYHYSCYDDYHLDFDKNGKPLNMTPASIEDDKHDKGK